MRLLVYYASGLVIATVASRPWVRTREYVRLPSQEGKLLGQQIKILPTEIPCSDLNSNLNISSIIAVSTSAIKPLQCGESIAVGAEEVSATRISSSDASVPRVPASSSLSDAVKISPRYFMASMATIGISEALPLPPKITPALSVAGVILILSGTIYTLIGIKITWIHIFFSATYLTNLSITVLITYVANPPISLALQGAYLVAVFVPGLLLGTGALVFKDITEGFGCLLGGFCLSMWLLALKSGGLVASTVGKAIFIGVFCTAAFALYISRHTRSYGIICSTSFSGATVITLGIDCFSRAGLKEFWLYIWALNSDIFPLLTVTYPITRGMRVELASIVLISMVGIMSQLKLWKVVQARRQKKAVETTKAKQRQEQLEEDLGRRLEEGNDRERAEWEQVYGGRPTTCLQQSKSGTDSEESANCWKPSTSSTKTNHLRTFRDQIEMNDFDCCEGSSPNDMESPEEVKGNPKITIQASHLMEVPGTMEGEHVHNDQDTQESRRRSSFNNFHREQDKDSSDLQDLERIIANDHEPSANPSDSITEALSLHVQKPVIDDEVVDKRSSMATFASSNYPQADLIKRTSAASLWRHISKHSNCPNSTRSKSQEKLVGTHNEYDSDEPIATNDDVTKGVERLKHPTIENMQNGLSSSSKRPSNTSNQQSPLNPSGNEDDQRSNCTEDELTISPFHKYPALSDSVDPSGASRIQPLNDGLASQLPGEASNAVLAHRTDEWAKQLVAAEVPIEDELLDATSRMESDQDQFDEVAATVHLPSLQQTALNAHPESNFTGHSRTLISPQPQSPSRTPRAFLAKYRNSQQHYGIRDHPPVQNSIGRESFHIRKNKTSAISSPSAVIPRKPVPQHVSILKTRGLRSSSSPIVESPIQEDVEASFSPRYTRSPLPATTLIAKRDTMLRNKHSIQSSTLSELSLTELSTPLTPDDSASAINYRSKSLDDEDISLSERRSLLHQQRQFTRTNVHPRSFTDPTVRRESMLAAWRTSIQHDFAASQIPSHEVEAHRTEMLRQKYNDSLIQQQANIDANVKSQTWAQAMKRGDMLDAHREVMRKMQAGVNRRLSEDSLH